MTRIERAWQEWKKTKPKVKSFPDLEPKPIRITGSAVKKGQIVVIQ